MELEPNQSTLRRFVTLARGMRDSEHRNAYEQEGFGWMYERLVADATHRASGQRLLSAVSDAVDAGGAVLEVGAGTGTDAFALATRRPDLAVVGSEPHGPMISRAEALPDRPSNLRWVQAPASALPFDDGRFDAVYSANAIKHFADPRACVSEMLRVLRPGGLLLVSELSPWVPFGSSFRFAREIPVPFFLWPVLTLRLRRSTANLLPDRAGVEAWFRGHGGAETFAGLEHAPKSEGGVSAFWIARLCRAG